MVKYKIWLQPVSLAHPSIHVASSALKENIKYEYLIVFPQMGHVRFYWVQYVLTVFGVVLLLLLHIPYKYSVHAGSDLCYFLTGFSHWEQQVCCQNNISIPSCFFGKHGPQSIYVVSSQNRLILPFFPFGVIWDTCWPDLNAFQRCYLKAHYVIVFNSQCSLCPWRIWFHLTVQTIPFLKVMHGHVEEQQ